MVPLKNNGERKECVRSYYHNFLRMNFDTCTIEKMFFNSKKTLKYFMVLENTILNQSKFDNDNDVEQEFNSLINEHKASNQTTFKHFTEYLNNFKTKTIYSSTISKDSRKTKEKLQSFYFLYPTLTWKVLIERAKITKEILKVSLTSIIHIIILVGLLVKIQS